MAVHITRLDHLIQIVRLAWQVEQVPARDRVLMTALLTTPGIDTEDDVALITREGDRLG